jgi:hypothetical protein
VVRGRRCKSLSRDFCVAVTADRVVALAIGASAEGGEGTDVIVKVKRGERGSWSRRAVRIDLELRQLRRHLRARQERDLEVQQDRLELEQVSALPKASHDEVIRAGHDGVEDLVGHAFCGL